MGLHRRDLRSASEQNENAGNGGDVIKHSVYLAVLDELREHERWREQLHVLETHAGKGVYAASAVLHASRFVTFQVAPAAPPSTGHLRPRDPRATQ